MGIRVCGMELNLVELSQRIKQRRLSLGRSLDEVALAAGQTRSWLSKVENFRITPSLPALARVADALGLTLSSLLEGLDAKPTIALTRVADRKKIERDPEDSNISYYSLVGSRPERKMDPMILTVPAGGGRDISRSHEGEEFLLVVQGRIKMEYGAEAFCLGKGDSVYFDANVPHRVYNPYQRDAQVLCVHHMRNPTDSAKKRSKEKTFRQKANR